MRAEKTQDQDACVRDGKAAGPGGVHTLAWRAPRWPPCFLQHGVLMENGVQTGPRFQGAYTVPRAAWQTAVSPRARLKRLRSRA